MPTAPPVPLALVLLADLHAQIDRLAMLNPDAIVAVHGIVASWVADLVASALEPAS